MSSYTYLDELENVISLPNHDNYYSLLDIDNAIDKDNRRIAQIKCQIIALCAGNPKELLVNKDECGEEFDPIDSLMEKINTLLEGDYGIEYTVWHKSILEIMKDNWNRVKQE